jgi:hypothetical protein
MSTYIRKATRAKKIVIPLDTARNNELLGSDLSAVEILDKSTGSFSLKFVFPDLTELTLDQTEVSNGKRFEWDIAELRITHSAQAGVTVKLLVEQQVP